MTKRELNKLLRNVADGKISIKEAAAKIQEQLQSERNLGKYEGEQDSPN